MIQRYVCKSLWKFREQFFSPSKKKKKRKNPIPQLNIEINRTGKAEEMM